MHLIRPLFFVIGFRFSPIGFYLITSSYSRYLFIYFTSSLRCFYFALSRALFGPGITIHLSALFPSSLEGIHYFFPFLSLVHFYIFSHFYCLYHADIVYTVHPENVLKYLTTPTGGRLCSANVD